MARKAQELENLKEGRGALARAAHDEPVFILRAMDKFAPEVIENWATRVDLATANFVNGTGNVDSTRKKIKEARALAHEMRAWQERNYCKIPD